jgi:hypothetical protein
VTSVVVVVSFRGLSPALIEPHTTIFLWINPVLKTFDRRVREHAASNVANAHGWYTAQNAGSRSMLALQGRRRKRDPSR